MPARQLLDSSEDSPSMNPSIADSLLRRAFDASPDATYLFGSDRRLLSFNRAGAEMGGSVMVGKACCEMFWHIEGAEGCVVDRAIETGERVEVEVNAGAESESPVSIIVEPHQPTTETTEPDHTSIQSGAFVIARDISALRRAEAEALAHKSFIASIADRTPDEIYALDAAGKITWMNERAEAYKLEMLPAVNYVDLISAESRQLAQENLARTLAGNDTECEIVLTRLDGSVRHAEAHSSPLWKDGEVDGALVFLRDVTERKRVHELMAQSDKLRAVGELAAGVAHNLNNSLTVIHGRAQLLQRNATDEASAKSLAVITNAVEDGTKTLRRILEFARRDSASEFVPVELGYLLSSSIDIARPKWQSKSSGRKIEVRLEETEPVYVMGEQAELREVVLNLMFNAVDAMPEGGTMEIGVRAEIESGCFWVADTGRGMEPEVVSRIFEPFFTTKGALGSGLGLSASHGIITRHKGEILVVSEPGEGTRFEVRLPVCEKNNTFLTPAKDVETDPAPLVNPAIT